MDVLLFKIFPVIIFDLRAIKYEDFVVWSLPRPARTVISQEILVYMDNLGTWTPSKIFREVMAPLRHYSR